MCDKVALNRMEGRVESGEFDTEEELDLHEAIKVFKRVKKDLARFSRKITERREDAEDREESGLERTPTTESAVADLAIRMCNLENALQDVVATTDQVAKVLELIEKRLNRS